MARSKIRVDPFEPKFFAELGRFKVEKAPIIKALSKSALAELANRTMNREVLVDSPPVMDLTPRHPFDAAGFIDAKHPGHWSCRTDLVFMTPIHSTGPNPGEWDGTVVHGWFIAPASSQYLVVTNFSGYQITMNLKGPWGTSSAYCPTPTANVAVSAGWKGTSGDNLIFTASCTGPEVGYLQSIKVYAVS